MVRAVTEPEVTQLAGHVDVAALTERPQAVDSCFDLAWGTGAAQAAHDAVLERIRSAGVTRAWLRAFTGNERGRRFYERLGWTFTGERTRSTFEPCPELLQYERELSGPDV